MIKPGLLISILTICLICCTNSPTGSGTIVTPLPHTASPLPKPADEQKAAAPLPSPATASLEIPAATTPVPVRTASDTKTDPVINPAETQAAKPENPIPALKAISIDLSKSLRQIETVFKAPEYPVKRNSQLLYITHDLDGDGFPEILVPGIVAKTEDYADFEYISNFSRLYDAENEEIKFMLYLFTYTNEQYFLSTKIDFGYHQVFKSFIKLYGNTKTADPVILAATFQTREGTSHKWVIFKKPILKPVSTLEFSETILKKVLIEDIDNNGTIDVVIQEKSIEERMGYETYLTWLNWNGRTYTEYKNTNIVRNLNAFLQKVKELLILGDLPALIKFAVEPGTLEKLEQAEATQNHILQTVFGIVNMNGSGENIPMEIKDIVLPEILDNPFYLKNEKGYYFTITYRIIYQEKISAIAEALIYMNKNPFAKRQFFFQIPGN